MCNSPARQADVEDSYAYQVLKLGFGEVLARRALVVEQKLNGGAAGLADIERAARQVV